MNLFLVTSALETRYSLFSLEDRITQTLETVSSIRKYAPDSHIIIVEGGQPLTSELTNRLSGYVDDIYDFTNTDVIQLSQSLEHYALDSIGHTVKTPCEAFMLALACGQLPPNTYERIFKISGRYVLTERFNLSDHMSAIGKYVFLPKAPVGEMDITNAPALGKSSVDFSDYCYETTFYSFCGSLLPQAIQNFRVMFNNIIQVYSSESYIDIETATYLTVDHTQVVEVSPIGIAGQLGMAQGLSINK